MVDPRALVVVYFFLLPIAIMTDVISAIVIDIVTILIAMMLMGLIARLGRNTINVHVLYSVIGMKSL